MGERRHFNRGNYIRGDGFDADVRLLEKHTGIDTSVDSTKPQPAKKKAGRPRHALSFFQREQAG